MPHWSNGPLHPRRFLAPGHSGDEKDCVKCNHEKLFPPSPKKAGQPPNVEFKPVVTLSSSDNSSDRKADSSVTPPRVSRRFNLNEPRCVPAKDASRPKSEPPSELPVEDVFRSLSQSEKVALALALACDRDTSREFDIEDIHVIVWQRYPIEFGIKNGRYPHSNASYVKLLRAVQEGLIEKVRASCYKITRKQRRMTASMLKREEANHDSGRAKSGTGEQGAGTSGATQGAIEAPPHDARGG